MGTASSAHLSFDSAQLVLEPAFGNIDAAGDLRAIEPAIVLFRISDSRNTDWRVDADAFYLGNSIFVQSGHREVCSSVYNRVVWRGPAYMSRCMCEANIQIIMRPSPRGR